MNTRASFPNRLLLTCAGACLCACLWGLSAGFRAAGAETGAGAEAGAGGGALPAGPLTTFSGLRPEPPLGGDALVGGGHHRRLRIQL